MIMYALPQGAGKTAKFLKWKFIKRRKNFLKKIILYFLIPFKRMRNRRKFILPV